MITIAKQFFFFILLLAITVLALASCDGGTPENKERLPNDYAVETLFRVNGCTVYKFYDEWDSHYFTDCGQTMSNVNCGKNCQKEELIGGSNGQ